MELKEGGRSMEKGQMKAILMVWMAIGVLAMESEASSFTSCYESCFVLCFILPYNSAFSCSLKCLNDCIIPSSLMQDHHHRDNQFFCRLGCASSLCSNLSTKDNPGGEKVESCVIACSQNCTRD